MPELLEAVERSLRENLQSNNKIRELRKAMEAGTATYDEADRYAVEVGQALAKAFHDNISSDTLPDGKMYYNIASRIIPPPLRTTYEDIADYAQAIQRGMNERAQLGIAAQRAKYNVDKEKGLIERACGADQYDNVRKSFEGDLINFDQAVVTDTLHENAEFQYQAGLSPVIRRIANGGCCAWCAKLAGSYPYEDVRKTGNDVYRRHRDCRCRVVYDPGDGKVQNVHTKRWEPWNGAAKENSIIARTDRNDIINYAKGLHMFPIVDMPPDNRIIDPSTLFRQLSKSARGREALDYLEENGMVANLRYRPVANGVRGSQSGNIITLNIANLKNDDDAAAALIHEITHHRYGIGECQWAETICFIEEYKYYNKTDIVPNEIKKTIIKQVKEQYPEFKWKKGGLLYGKPIRLGKRV